MKRLKRAVVYISVIALLSSILGGCGLIASTGLDDNEEELVAEYAAGVLMRYSADKKGGLGNPPPAPKPTPAPEEPAPISEEDKTSPADEDSMEDEPDAKPEETDKKTQEVSADAVPVVPDGKVICEAIGISGFDLEYKGFETADIYPRSDGNDLTFSMQAAPGKKLVVLHFDLENTGSSDALCNVLDCNVKFRILVNETDRINEQMTILLNDLKSYNNTIGAGQKEDVVLVFEANVPVAESIGSLSLIVVNGIEESTFRLM